jgi:uncharacterized phage protein (TIGR02218 family)
MLTVLNNLESLRTGRLHRLCQLWKLTRTDGTILRFTDHSHELVYLGETYEPSGGFSPTAQQKQTGLRSRNQELMGMLSSGKITDGDLHAGKYDSCLIEIFRVDWLYPWAGSFDRQVYRIESVTFSSEHWEASIIGLTGLLQKANGELVTRMCQNDLGDGICRVNLTSSTVTRSVLTVTNSRRIFTASLTGITNPYVGGAIADGYFTAGKLVWTSGPNLNLASEIRAHTQSSGTLELELETPFDIGVGNSFTIYPGCDKTWSTCLSKFANRPNYKGAPDVPGTDKMIYPR